MKKIPVSELLLLMILERLCRSNVKIQFALDYFRNYSYAIMYLLSPLKWAFRTSIDFVLDETKGFYHRNTEANTSK